jgi:hypothetical protein
VRKFGRIEDQKETGARDLSPCLIKMESGRKYDKPEARPEREG